MSTGGFPSGLDAPTRPSRDHRSLNAILEDPEENKSVTTEGESFFSDEEDTDTISLPKFTPLAASVSKITFVNSSFSNLIKQNPVAPLQLGNSAKTDQSKNSESISTTHGNSSHLMDFDNINSTFPKKMSRIELGSDSEVLSPGTDHEESGLSNDDPFGFFLEEFPARNPLLDAVDNTASNGVQFAEDFLEVGEKPRSQSVRKVIQPDSPVSPEDIDFARMTLEISSDTEKLKAELESARQEIADLVHAVHQKDQSVIDAHKKIEDLKHDAISEKRDGVSMQRRLETALANANQLESKNVLLRTQMDEMEQDHRSVAKSLRDIAVLFNMHNIPADDEDLGIHLKAKVTTLLNSEAELSKLKMEQKDFDYTEKNLVEDLVNIRAALNTEKMLRSQAESLNVRNVEIRDSDILHLQAELNDAKKKRRDQEDLSHAVAAEARALSEELKDTHEIIDRKDQEIQSLRSKLRKNSDIPSAMANQPIKDASSDEDDGTIFGRNFRDADQIEQLKAENISMKEELVALRRKLIRTDSFAGSPNEKQTPKNPSNRQSLLQTGPSNSHGSRTSQPPDVVVSDQRKDSPHVGKVKRELKILNAALSQVISASNSAISKLKMENSTLVGRLSEYERNEPILREDLSAKSKQIDYLTNDLSEVRNNLQSVKPASAAVVETTEAVLGPSVEWSETNLRTVLRQLRDTMELGSLQKDTTMQSVFSQQQQIAALADNLRRLQADVQAHAASIAPTSQISIATMGQREPLPEDEVERRQQDEIDITVLRKMLSEREDEIEHWRKVCAKMDLTILDSPAQLEPVPYPFNQPPANQRCWSLVPAKNNNASAWIHNGSHVQVSPDDPGIFEGSSGVFTSTGTSASRRRSSSLSVRSSEEQFSATFLADQEPVASRPPANEYHGTVQNASIESGSVPNASEHHTGQTNTDWMDNGDFSLPQAKTANEPRRVSMSSFNELRNVIGPEWQISTAPKLTLPSVDYDSIRQRSRNQLAQLEDLCQRIDRANERYITLLPSKIPGL